MRPNEVALAALALLALIIIFYFITARGPVKKISITNADGSTVSVSVEIANNTATRMKGLMGRKSLGAEEGMLFVFDRPGKHSFWMMNTTIPLDAIFIAENGSVVDIIAMQPCGWNVTNCPTYAPKTEAKYVLEVNPGFAARNRIVVGKGKLLPMG